ncbi:hypothetical protein, partial [Pseudomonas syringae group genomosp. 7]|uniref:hypothetical protein n=1 Tax=Pseudomonas syringae group genomosp. 7 TaxID=251699 RepID=UPI00376F6EA6
GVLVCLLGCLLGGWVLWCFVGCWFWVWGCGGVCWCCWWVLWGCGCWVFVVVVLLVLGVLVCGVVGGCVDVGCVGVCVGLVLYVTLVEVCEGIRH